MPDIFLYGGEANPQDIKLRDPTTTGGVAGTATPAGLAIALSRGTSAVTGAGNIAATGRSITLTLGTVVATGGSAATPTGQAITFGRGTTTQTGAGTTAPSGQPITLSLGTAVATGDAVQPPADTGSGGSGKRWNFFRRAPAKTGRVFVRGHGITLQLGQVKATGGAGAFPPGLHYGLPTLRAEIRGIQNPTDEQLIAAWELLQN